LYLSSKRNRIRGELVLLVEYLYIEREECIMTKSDGKYPNKEDFEPKVAGVGKSDELPLADPSDSNVTEVFRKNEQKKTGENEPSAFSINKVDSDYNKPKSEERFSHENEDESDREFNQESHDKWNGEKTNNVPAKP